MITVRPSEERGRVQIDWLDSRHSFSFGEYYDPAHMGFGALRVINEDRVLPGEGFHTHGHRDMEIISYVLDGALAHRDSTGHEAVIRPGQVQAMGAGTGIRHSEFNHSPAEGVHFLQIWIEPDSKGYAPRYADASFPAEDRKNRLLLVGSKDGAEGSLVINQDVRLYAGLLDPDAEVAMDLASGRRAWVQVARGGILLNGTDLETGDGAAVEEETTLKLTASQQGAEVLVFDLA